MGLVMARNTRSLLGMIAGSVLLAACSTIADSSGGSSPSAVTPQANESSETFSNGQGQAGESNDGESSVVSNCEPVSADMLAHIALAAQQGTGMKPLAGAAVRSPDFAKVYFIAMQFSATGIDDQTGVWVSNSLEPGGAIVMSADGFAKQFTDWPDAASTDAAIGAADPSIDAAKACL